MALSWWNSAVWWRSPALWIGVGVLLFVAGRVAENRLSGRAVKESAAWPYLREAVIAAYSVIPAFAGIPLALLFPSALGVESSVWLPRFFKGLGMFAALFLVLMFFVLVSRGRGRKRARGSYPWWMGLRDGIYDQAHWGFYRGLVAMAGLGVYAATWLGALVALVEWTISGVATGLPPRGKSALFLGVLLTTSALFLYSRNLWLCMIFHWLAMWVAKGEWS